MENNKVVSLRELQYIQMYKSYFKDVNNQKLALSVFFKGDTVNKIRVV